MDTVRAILKPSKNEKKPIEHLVLHNYLSHANSIISLLSLYMSLSGNLRISTCGNEIYVLHSQRDVWKNLEIYCLDKRRK